MTFKSRKDKKRISKQVMHKVEHRAREALEEEAYRLLYPQGTESDSANELSLETIERARFNSLPIYTNDRLPAMEPKIKLSHRVKVSNKFRSEYNKWLLDRFGGRPIFFIFPDPNPLSPGQRSIWCHPCNYPWLKAQMDKQALNQEMATKTTD